MTSGLASHSPAGHTIAALAAHLGGVVAGRADLVIHGLAPLHAAQPDELTFIVDRHWAAKWPESEAGAAVVRRDVQVPEHDNHKRALIRVDDAESAMVQLLRLFSPPIVAAPPGIHPSAVVHPTAVIGPAASIGPFVTIDEGVRLGRGVVIHAGCRIESGCEIGDECVLYQNVVIRRDCVLGRRVILHSGVAIGTDGFGYIRTAEGNDLIKVPHVGNVLIEDDVEIGANSCIDRAKFGSTIIGARTKIDNLVQVGHNCRIGRACVLAGLTGLAGSAVLGDRVEVGGNVGIADHITVGDGARLGGKAGLMDDVAAGEEVFGYPAVPAREAFRQFSILRTLRAWMREVEGRLRKVEKSDSGRSGS